MILTNFAQRVFLCSGMLLVTLIYIQAQAVAQTPELNIGQIEDAMAPDLGSIEVIEPPQTHLEIPGPADVQDNPLFWDGVNNDVPEVTPDAFEEEVDVLINNFEQGISNIEETSPRASREYIDKDFSTVFFTKWELETLLETRQISLKRTLKEKEQFIDMAIADITDEERPLTAEEKAAIARRERLVAEAKMQRDISLSGIYYKAQDDWVVWLNGQRIEPGETPQAVVEMTVQRDYVEIKWLDYYTNKIFPIRLRPHQIFNLDELVFLPERS